MIFPAHTLDEDAVVFEAEEAAPEAPAAEDRVAAELMEQWISVLDELAEQIPAAQATAAPWAPEKSLAPLPAALRDRAVELARSQSEAIVALEESMLVVAAELAALVPVRRSSAGIYLDVMG